MQLDLIEPDWRDESLGEGAVVLRGFVLPEAQALFEVIAQVSADAPFRHLVTPGGRRMSVAMTNCGSLGWVSDATGYRYDPVDPESGRRWPPMPPAFATLAERAAGAAGYPGFAPEACLVNCYASGARLSLHQDRDERNLSKPIVSVSLGLPATFLWGGAIRADRPQRIVARHGDVIVWGGPSRLHFHGVEPLAPGNHPLTGGIRYNLTFRQVG